MARSFSSADAQKLIKEHERLLSEIEHWIASSEDCKADVFDAIKAVKAREVLKILAGIPVEELNRSKRGIRVKALREHNYSTIADVYTASAYTLSTIYGISSSAAYQIKTIANQIASQASSGVKVRLTTDDKNKDATRLVYDLSFIRRSEPYLVTLRQIALQESDIRKAIDDLQPGTSGLKWLFSFSEKKQRATRAYQYLSDLYHGDYGEDVQNIVSILRSYKHGDTAKSWGDFAANSVRFYNILEDMAPGALGTDDAVYGLPEDLAREIQEEQFFPDGLLCELRRYQEWGVKYALHQERILLGDEMGLGKTVQAIAVMVSLRNTGGTHFVVVCPASVLTNWYREIRKMSKLQPIIIHGPSRSQALKTWIKTGGVAVTTYETTKYLKLAPEFKFAQLVVDEAHYIKNPEAARSKYVRVLCDHTDRIMFMTGTALENRVDEMVALIRILRPDIAKQVAGMEALSAAPRFRELVAPVYYRRKREDVLTELPDLIETQEWCTLFADEEDVYEEAVLGKHYADARRVSWNIDDLHYSSKATRMEELIDEAESEGRKVIVFSFFLDTIGKIHEFLGDRCTNPITGSVPPSRRQQIIDEFDSAPAGHVLLAQIQSGGTGLNIQSASVVIICEPQFKPSIENQAISRAYRMGQTRNVLVYRLLCENTVDEHITDILETKQQIFDSFADKSVAAQESLNLDDRTFGNIIEEEIKRIKAKKGLPPDDSDEAVSE